ncbi:MAG: glycosyltransferase family 4 protein [Dehalococcoidia bacterium]|nr:glycosyltransferase family 4 protein [Dehalococcoidia bacterium]
MRQRIGIVGIALAPHFNEMSANQMSLLSHQLGANVLTANDIGLVPFRRMGRYFIANTRFLLRKTPLLSYFNGALFYLLLKLFERRVDVVYLADGLRSRLLRYVEPRKCIPVVASIPVPGYGTREARVKRVTGELRGMLAQSERVKARLVDMGVDHRKIQLMYPWVDLDRFVCSPPPPRKVFTLLFASSPTVESRGEDNFAAKGVPLLLEAFREFAQTGEALLHILWRGKHNDDLEREIGRPGLRDKVTITDEVVDMPQWYARAHATVVPFLTLHRSSEIPLSAVESLACGRPVIATDVGEIADIVRDHECGCVARPTSADLLTALQRCRESYQTYQGNCRRVAEKLFRLDTDTLEELHKAF